MTQWLSFLKKYCIPIILIFSPIVSAQTMRYDNLSSITFGGIPYQKNSEVIQYYVSIDYLQPIMDTDFYLGGKISMLKSTENDDEHREYKTIIPEVYLRKYISEAGICPYAQWSFYYPGTSFDLGIKPNAMLFDMDFSIGYIQPFRKNGLEHYPYFAQGFKFSMGVSINIQTWF